MRITRCQHPINKKVVIRVIEAMMFIHQSRFYQNQKNQAVSVQYTFIPATSILHALREVSQYKNTLNFIILKIFIILLHYINYNTI